MTTTADLTDLTAAPAIDEHPDIAALPATLSARDAKALAAILDELDLTNTGELAVYIAGLHRAWAQQETRHRADLQDVIARLDQLTAQHTAVTRRHAETNAELRRQLVAARTDKLTGLPTRSAWIEQATEALSRPAGSRIPYILLLDLRRLKAVNDHWGHAAGDHVIAVQGARLAQWCKDRGIAARFGGDELVAKADLEPSEFAHQLDALVAIMAEPVTWAGTEITAYASIGLAVAGDLRIRPLEVLLTAADTAMYRTKHSEAPCNWGVALLKDYVAPEDRPGERLRDTDDPRASHDPARPVSDPDYEHLLAASQATVAAANLHTRYDPTVWLREHLEPRGLQPAPGSAPTDYVSVDPEHATWGER